MLTKGEASASRRKWACVYLAFLVNEPDLLTFRVFRAFHCQDCPGGAACDYFLLPPMKEHIGVHS